MWTESWWTLANSFVVVRYTNRVQSTSILIAHVVTGVFQSVAKLSRRAIDVVNARYSLTTLRRVVRITGIESDTRRWTFAVSNVIMYDAQGIWTTRNKVANWLARQHSVAGRFAGLIFGAVGVGLTLIFVRALTSVAIVRVSVVSRETLAVGLMVFGYTLRVGRASERFAD